MTVYVDDMRGVVNSIVANERFHETARDAASRRLTVASELCVRRWSTLPLGDIPDSEVVAR